MGKAQLPAQEATVFSYWRTTVPQSREANARIEAQWRSHPEGASQLVLQVRQQPRQTHVLTRGDWLKPGRTVTSGRASVLHPLPPGAPAQPPDLRPLAGGPSLSHDSQGDRSTVSGKAYFGADRRDQRRPGHPSGATVASALARLARGRIHRRRVEPEEVAPAHRHVGHLSSIVESDPGFVCHATRTTSCWPAARASGSMPRSSATSSCRRADCCNPTIGGRSMYPPLPEVLDATAGELGPKPWPEDTGPRRTGEPSTRSAIRSVPYPLLQILQCARMANLPAFAGRAPTLPCKHS